ncbi:ras GEF [Coprinellus micaceus]|uniref:Ras GEF n=1 Tax=Coprinellus micaceus TaxID=71717 RepID=A0A4Y7TM31_COPMI|nr:ras GEF [Coprinellus micaceus]
MPAAVSSDPEAFIEDRNMPRIRQVPRRENDPDTQHRTLLPPAHTLRKSISVDSFNAGLNGTRPNHAISGGQPDSPQSPTRFQSNFQNGDQERVWGSRSRGASVSTVQDGYESPSLLDSDVERFDPINVPPDRYRHLSLKSQDAQRPILRGGELLLPARSPQGLSATSSMSSIMTGSANSSPRDAHPALRSVTSLQASSLRSNQTARKDLGRARSGSLGVHATPSHPIKRMTINTQVDTGNALPLVTLAVIGTSTTGKSSVIRKGLANYHLSDSITAHVPDHPSIRSVGQGGYHQDALPEGSLLVIEVDVPPDLSDLPQLPPDLPPIDGIVVCYDASNPTTFQPVETLLRGYRAVKLPVIVLACKADLERRIEPDRALETLQEYDVGLVEVTTAQDGKGKMRQSFDWLIKSQSQSTNDNRNPASPEYLRNPSQPWDSARTSTPTATLSTASGINTVPFDSSISSSSAMASPSIPPSLSTMSPASPTRARSTGDLLAERDKPRPRTQTETSTPAPFTQRSRNDSRATQETTPSPTLAVVTGMIPPKPMERKKGTVRKPATQPYATLDELLDKLLFLAVSGDDPGFVSHFLLTYRRFATPRSVLLAMQKRMRQLDNPCGDPMFACFAQMRICNLLETWIRDYPDDFAVKGTAGALNALIRSIISKTHLLHYGSEFLPFFEMLPSRYDQDAAWALKVDISADESDDSYSFLEGEEDETEAPPPLPPSETGAAISPPQDPSQSPAILRERKSSLPLSKSVPSPNPHHSTELSPKQHLKDLLKLANDVLNVDSEEFAQEITRQWSKQFLSIKPRDWLHYVFLIAGKSSKNKPDTPTINPIAASNDAAEHLGLWTISLILAHDRMRPRARQIEKFVDIAHRLRVLNNYAALRAIVAGINAATFGAGGEETMDLFKAKCPEQGKNFKSFDVLLQQGRAHRAYRACIPALEVHLMDLVRANEGNLDFNEADPTKIHWGKFNMMGRFIDTTTQCQVQCRNSTDYDFMERPALAELLVRRPVMSEEGHQVTSMRNATKPPNTTEPKDVKYMRRVFFW